MTGTPDGELSSWKEIATYLGVGIRTAQVWERERGLPVHRLPGARGRVLANVAELDAWKLSGVVIPDAPPAPTTAAIPVPVRPIWNRYTLGATIAAVSLAAVMIIATKTSARTPASFRLERDTLVVLDERGRECWRKMFPYALSEANHPDRASWYTWIGDLDGDGHPEVLFAPHPLTEAQESTPLICYSMRGTERWRYANTSVVRSTIARFAPFYGVARFLVASRGRGQPNAILVTTAHGLYYPSKAALLSPEGRVLREYWHSGHLNHLQAADLDGDGRNEFYLAGISNAWHSATVVVLDEDHFSGASAEPDNQDYQLLGFAPAVECARVILPRTCLNTTLEPFNTVAGFTVRDGEITVETAELLSPLGAGIFHHLTPDFFYHSVISDSYRSEYQHRHAVGELAQCNLGDAALQSLRIITPRALKKAPHS